MTDTVQRYIRNYYIYKRIKAYREIKAGLLKPLLIPDRYWKDIIINFIISLSKYRRYRRVYKYIIVIVDRLSKKHKFIGLDFLKVKAVI